MDRQAEVLVGVGAAVLVVVAHRRGRRRALRVGASARKYLSGRYGVLPKDLIVNCSDPDCRQLLPGGRRRREHPRIHAGGPRQE